MESLQENYEKLPTEQLETKRIDVEREIDRWTIINNLDGLYRNLNKRDTIITVLTTRYNGVFTPITRESESKKSHTKTIPILTSISLDGTVTINIAHFGYTYRIDAGFIPKIQRLFRHNPWAAVNTLKRKAYHVSKQTYQQKER